MVDVVIPFFNAAGTLDATIQSALAQTGVELDIVLVDDGSSDGSLAIAKGFCPAVRVFTGPNRGVSAARNRGMAETKSEWIIFLDADDLLVPGTISKRLEAAETSNADVVICDWQEFSGASPAGAGAVRSVDMAALAADAETACATHLWATTAALMYRRSLVEKIAGFRHDLPVIQDARLLFDAAFHGARFVRSPHVGAQYRVVPDSLSRRDPGRFWRDVLTNAKQIEMLWRSRAPLTPKQQTTLAGLYDVAARGLFVSEQSEYFEAVECERRQDGRLPLHPRFAVPLARTLGLRRAKQVLRLLGR